MALKTDATVLSSYVMIMITGSQVAIYISVTQKGRNFRAKQLSLDATLLNCMPHDPLTVKKLSSSSHSQDEHSWQVSVKFLH